MKFATGTQVLRVLQYMRQTVEFLIWCKSSVLRVTSTYIYFFTSSVKQYYNKITLKSFHLQYRYQLQISVVKMELSMFNFPTCGLIMMAMSVWQSVFQLSFVS